MKEPKLSTRARTRRDSRIRSFCKRGELARGTRVGKQPDEEFLRELAAFHPMGELHWNPVRQRWALYTCYEKKASACDDALVLEFELNGKNGTFEEPGRWMIDLMKKWDKTARGATDPKRGDFEWKQRLKRQEEAFEREKDRRLRDMSGAFTKDAWAYRIGRHSVDIRESPLV